MVLNDESNDDDRDPIDLAEVRRVLRNMKAQARPDDAPAQRMVRKYEKLIRQEARRQRGR